MFDEKLMPARNVISLADVRRQRRPAELRVRLCCHCGAALGEGENEDECSGAGFAAVTTPARRRVE